jgi:N utilization substance protein B
MRKRTRSREFALQILYQIDINHLETAAVFDDFWKDRSDLLLSDKEKEVIELDKKDPEVRKYTEMLVSGTLEHLVTIDRTIEKYAENWEICRMAYVDRNILRLSTYEMCHLEDIPLKVAINEAVELAKRYGEPDSSKFVNGILDKIAKNECKK